MDSVVSRPARRRAGRRKTPWLKLAVSAWLCYHLAGLVIAPASVPPSSDLVRNSWRLVGPYLQCVFMNHGFHFFAPDPGAATIVRYTVELPGGKEVRGQIPDKSAHRPRLLYHRHFMLTEFLANGEGNPSLQPLLIRALARQICREHGAELVTLYRVTHRLPTMEFCRAGMPLDAPELFDEQPLGRFVLSDL